MANCNLLAEDLVIEILSWLPVRSIVRFRCVCKSWYALFRSPNFVSKHYNNSQHLVTNDHHRLILNRHFRNRRESFMSLSYDTLQVLDDDLGYHEHNPTLCNRILGTFNGIVCLVTIKDDVIFWNPAIRQTKVAPKCPFLSRPGFMVQTVLDYGFGFDFKGNDFKVVVVTRFLTYSYYPSEKPENFEVINEVAVYSSHTNLWRLIDGVFPIGYSEAKCCCPSATCVKGVYSRLMMTHRDRELVDSILFTFDMSDEVFILTPVETLSLDVFNSRDRALTSLNDSVACITFEAYLSRRSFEIYILNEYGPNGIWTKLYTIGPLSDDIMRPLGFWKNDALISDDIMHPLGLWKNDELIFKIGNRGLLLCDPTTNEFKNFYFEGYISELVEYKESLVWFYGGNHRILT